MRFTVLGSCSGTEARPHRRHTSTLLEAGGKLYMLDAGDSCAYTAHMLGFDVTKIDSVFISHPHIDHVGGLPYLFFMLAKLMWCRGLVFDRPFDIYTPASSVVAGALMMHSYGFNTLERCVVTHAVSDGLLYDDGVLRVSARHNGHLREEKPPYHSFSYLLELEGKRVIYSGDIAHISELNGWLEQADLLLMETGHHDPVEVARYLKSLPARPRKLVFVHHGLTMLADPEGCVARAREILSEPVDAAYDGMQFEL